MPATLLGALLAPRLLLVGATALLRGTLTPAAALLTGLTLTLTLPLPLPLAGTGSSGLALAGLRRLTGLRPSRLLLAPATAALLRRLALLRGLLGLLGALTPTATTLALAGGLLAPTALASLSPLLPA